MSFTPPQGGPGLFRRGPAGREGADRPEAGGGHTARPAGRSPRAAAWGGVKRSKGGGSGQEGPAARDGWPPAGLTRCGFGLPGGTLIEAAADLERLAMQWRQLLEWGGDGRGPSAVTAGWEVAYARRAGAGVDLGGFFLPPPLLAAWQAGDLEEVLAGQARLRRGSGGTVELFARRAPAAHHKLLLVDDPGSAPGRPSCVADGEDMADYLRALGVGHALLRTSARSVQILLQAPVALDRVARAQAQRALAARLHGDPASTSGDHWHRVPGSAHGKTRTVQVAVLTRINAGKAVPAEWLADDRDRRLGVAGASFSHLPAGPTAASEASARRGGAADESPSADDLRLAWRLYKSRASRADAVAEIEARGIARGKRWPDYAEWTVGKVEAAIRERGLRPWR